jgi:hypothetical protein
MEAGQDATVVCVLQLEVTKQWLVAAVCWRPTTDDVRYPIVHALVFGPSVGAASTDTTHVNQTVHSALRNLGLNVDAAVDIYPASFEASTTTDACIRACAAAWTAAYFRDQDFEMLWQDTTLQWPRDAFVAGFMRCDEAARLVLAHALVGCSPALNKALAARKVAAEAVQFETKARRIKMAAVQHESDARRLNAAMQLDAADAMRVAIANAPDSFPVQDYPYNRAHHMFLWTPALDGGAMPLSSRKA